MTYEEYKREAEAKRIGLRGFGEISNKKPLTMARIIEIDTENAKYMESQEKARKKAQITPKMFYNGYMMTSEGHKEPVSKVPNPNAAFRRKKDGGDYLEYKGRPYKKMPKDDEEPKTFSIRDSSQVLRKLREDAETKKRILDNGIHAKVVEEEGYDIEDEADWSWDEDGNQTRRE